MPGSQPRRKAKAIATSIVYVCFGYVVIHFFDSQTDVEQLVQAIEGMDISKTISSGDAVTTEEESGAQSHVKTKAEKKEAKKEKERRQKEMKKQSKQSTKDTPDDTASSSVSLDSAMEQSVDSGKAEGDSVNANSNPDPATASTVDPSLSVVEPVTGSEPLVTSSQATGEDVAEDVEDDKDDDNDDKKKKKKKKKKTDKEEDKKATKVCVCVCVYILCVCAFSVLHVLLEVHVLYMLTSVCIVHFKANS